MKFSPQKLPFPKNHYQKHSLIMSKTGSKLNKDFDRFSQNITIKDNHFLYFLGKNATGQQFEDLSHFTPPHEVKGPH